MRALAGLLAVASILAVPALAAAGTPRPNVLVVMTDDQRLDDMRAMPRTTRLLGDGGTTFERAHVSYPLCCPSRATFLTGQYSHNHGITWNFEPFGGYSKFRRTEGNSLPVWLQRAGYTTGLIGKYLNEYGERDPRRVPPGWSDWQASVDPTTYQYYGYTLNVNGRLVKAGRKPRDYMTDAYARRAQTFIRRQRRRAKPWFLWVTPNAPHTQSDTGRSEGTPAVPAPRHAERFADEELPRPPSFDEEDLSDKPAILSRFPRVDVARMTAHNRGRLGSLAAVDEMIERLVGTLRRTGQLEDTVVVFTSDNGWLLGEHRIAGQKYFGFEEAIRVPLLIRGPGFPRGRRVEDLVVNVDLAPTILRAAGARAGRTADGVALQGVAARPGALVDRDMVIETGPNTPGLPFYAGLHTRRYAYEEVTTGEFELYDLVHDPFQLQSVHDDPRYANVRAELHRRLELLKVCKGAACLSAQGSPEPLP
jgi:arylsulfatase A-like enzyme